MIIETVSMNKPAYLEVKEGYAHFRPEGEATLKLAIALVGDAIKYCHDEGISRLLADVTHLKGNAPPTIVERYWIAQEWAKLARGQVAVALVVRPEVIDPEKFEVIAATNLGQTADVFSAESEALDWLLKQKHFNHKET